MNWPHWVVLPVVLPLLAGAALLLVERRRPQLAFGLSLAATLALAAIALGLLAGAAGGQVTPYLLGNWRAPFGIALALDRLAALMLALTAVIALASLLYARAGDAGRGPHFHALFQFQLMGLNGAFLTADLFNLFVFFEVLLIASYGLLLHGGGPRRLKASVHYVAFNLAGSALFLIAVSLLYGVTGTLNLADLAQRVAAAPAGNAALVQAGGLLLLVVFCVKAALLPLYFWLPDTYAAATPPVAALFAIMTKVGIYAIARVYTLVFGADAGVAALVAQPWLAWLALGTLLLAAIGVLAATRLRTLVAYAVVASAGTLLLALGLGTPGTVAAGLFYLVPSTLVAAAMFLLVDRIARARGMEAPEGVAPPGRDALQPLPWQQSPALLGALFFACAVSLAGMPPLAGFLGKLQLLHAAAAAPYPVASWAVILVSSFAVIFALARAGSTVFWAAQRGTTPPDAPATTLPHAGQRAALALLLGLVLASAAGAGPLAAYAEATAGQLFERRPYIDAVLGAQPAPPAWNLREGMVK